MRRSSLLLALLLTACTESKTDKPGQGAAEPDEPPTAAEPEPDTDGEPVKKPGNVVSETEAELAQCVATCIEANVAAAKPAEVIEADCRTSCDQQHPPTQVEVRR